MATVMEVQKGLDLRALADIYEATVKVRNAAANRLRAVAQGRDEGPEAEEITNSPLMDRLEEALDQARIDMQTAFAEHPIYRWMMGIPGINRTLGCRVLGIIPMSGPEDFPTFSKLRVFAGLCPGRNRLVKGQKACFSTRLKTALFVAFGNLLKAEPAGRRMSYAPKEFYTDIYRKWRSIYLERHGEGKAAKEKGWPDLRQHLAAKNKLLDVFLSHVWRTWREAEGWTVDSLYVHEVLGHQMQYEPADFSSVGVAERKIKKAK